MNKNLKIKIIELRDKGFSYNEIQKKLNCSKSTISFHCNSEVKEKTYDRQRKRRKIKPLEKKIEGFLRDKKTTFENEDVLYESCLDRLRLKTWHFVRMRKSKKQKRKYGERMFNEQQLLDKIGPNPICYLTGRPINLNQSRSYALDHFVARSKGGTNSIENCEIACREANQAKHNLSYEEFVQLCRDVVNHHDSKRSR